MRVMVLLVLMVLASIYCGCGSVGNSAGDAAPPVYVPQPEASQGPRCDPSQPFFNVTLVPKVKSSSEDGALRLSSDEPEMIFSSDRPGGSCAGDLYVAKRASLDAELGTHAFARGTWTTQHPMLQGLQGPAASVINGKLYVASGCCAAFTPPFPRFNDLQVYDPATDSWTAKAPIPLAVYFAPSGMVSIGNSLYVAGGAADQIHGNNVATLQAYDSVADSWSTGPSLLSAGSAQFGGVIHGKLYVASGQDPSNTVQVGTTSVFDPATNTWSPLAPIPTPRAGGGSGVLNGKLFTVGGLQNGGIVLPTLEAFDPATNSWSQLAPMPTARYAAGVGVLNGLLFVVGGNDGSTVLDTVEAYNPVSNTWSSMPHMTVPSQLPGVGVIDGVLYVAGGFNANQQPQDNLQAFVSDCQVRPGDVTLRPLTQPGNVEPIYMTASYTPTSGHSLAQLAADCGFDGFDWVQTITHWPGPSALKAQRNPTVPIIIPPMLPINDPPLGGYASLASQQPPFLGAYPFYYNTASLSDICILRDPNGTCTMHIVDNAGFTLNLFDVPFDGCLKLSANLNPFCEGPSTSPKVISFTTQLVGICNATPSALCTNGARQPSAPLFQWTWDDNYTGSSSGGVFNVQTAGLTLPDPRSGTGGITITSLNGVEQTPPKVTCTATPTTLWPPNDKQVSVSVSGTISAGTSAVVAGSPAFVVVDSEASVEPGGPVTVASDGGYSFTVLLVASRDGNDKNGRQYRIGVSAADGIGNIGSCSSVVSVPHDQGH